MARPRTVLLAIALVLGILGAGARVAYASCSSDSDCAGLGKCSNGKCGACGSDSDCKFGTCSSGRCGACGSDSDCRGHGKCSGGRCGACGSDSDCRIGKCSSGKCGACGSDSDCKGGRCSSGRCSNALGAGLDALGPNDGPTDRSDNPDPADCGAPSTHGIRFGDSADLTCSVSPEPEDTPRLTPAAIRKLLRQASDVIATTLGGATDWMLVSPVSALSR